ncbi:hypothetical protein [Nostoc sp.]
MLPQVWITFVWQTFCTNDVSLGTSASMLLDYKQMEISVAIA